jgi:uncharacterized protein involved in exopolysaccharide biosynthesis
MESTTIGATADSPRTERYIDLGEFLRLLWARRWRFAGTVAVFVVGAATVAFLMTPVYRSTTILVPAEVETSGMGSLLGGLGELGGLAALAGLDLGSTGNPTVESLAVLRSRSFTEAFIRDRDLLPLLFDGDWNADDKRWHDPENPPSMADGYKYFDERVRTVTQDARTGIVTVHVDWRDPEVSAEWANVLVDRLNAEMRSRAIERTNASVRFLEEELVNTTIVDTRTAISRLMETQINQRMLANVTKEYAFRVIDRALPADDDDPVRPRKLLIVVMAAAAGLLAGILLVLATRRMG